MNIQLENVGKRFRYEWIFKGINQAFETGKRYGILGPNGSGKSTLMKVLSGQSSPSKGSIKWQENGTAISPESVWKSVSYAAPYIDLIEEFTLTEAIQFQGRMKPFLPELSTENILEILELPRTASRKEVRFFSSGMKQRVKLVLAICANSSLVLLDEPTTNLDIQTVEWYQRLLNKYSGENRLFVIASNDPRDIDVCERFIKITDFKEN